MRPHGWVVYSICTITLTINKHSNTSNVYTF
uniref:SAM-dependent MTase RsmB/NOP-type domain-containing protein n=1 Tax=Anguilla anguilla TaxID=7936 RepID=A0A0E9SB60_ANGAN